MDGSRPEWARPTSGHRRRLDLARVGLSQEWTREGAGSGESHSEIVPRVDTGLMDEATVGLSHEWTQNG
ncbi:hypothetical protein NDU88_007257 [Pleurodeles waltl]|uniref:Uncharacterized protein n=1 Tax=Pleurodeles waltl TaxID=8319 RepID=A0AAV7WCY6_PLEWA|nr:hypothetical protein NDU88_007257 [Pleurodeles waltl]